MKGICYIFTPYKCIRNLVVLFTSRESISSITLAERRKWNPSRTTLLYRATCHFSKWRIKSIMDSMIRFTRISPE